MKIVITPKQYGVISEDRVWGYGDPIAQILKGVPRPKFRLGSAELGYDPLTRKNIEFWIREFIWQYFFDSEFFYNYCNDDMRKNYKEAFKIEVVEPFLSNLDHFFMRYVIKNLSTYTIASDFNGEEFIDDFFRKSEIINDDTRLTYNKYRWSYAGKKPDPNRYEYSGTWPNNKVTPK